MSSRRAAAGGARDGDGSSSARATLQRHLDSERPDTDSRDVAKVWALAYSELVDFEEKVLAHLHELMPSLTTEARHEAELTNLPMIVQHLQTFRYRRAHWRQRLQELDGH